MRIIVLTKNEANGRKHKFVLDSSQDQSLYDFLKEHDCSLNPDNEKECFAHNCTNSHSSACEACVEDSEFRPLLNKEGWE